jgi:hypothetical protein
VQVAPGATVVLRIALEPTPDYRARFTAHAQAVRTWGIVATIGGLLVAGAGTGLLVYDAGQRRDGTNAYSALTSETGPGQPCHPPFSPTYTQMCTNPANAYAAQSNDANTRDYAGWAAVGVGAAATGLGLVLLVTGDSPHKYDAPSSDELAASRGTPAASLTPTFWAGRGGGGVAVLGAF